MPEQKMQRIHSPAGDPRRHRHPDPPFPLLRRRFRFSSKTASQKRHLAAPTTIISPHSGQGRRGGSPATAPGEANGLLAAARRGEWTRRAALVEPADTYRSSGRRTANPSRGVAAPPRHRRPARGTRHTCEQAGHFTRLPATTPESECLAAAGAFRDGARSPACLGGRLGAGAAAAVGCGNQPHVRAQSGHFTRLPTAASGT